MNDSNPRLWARFQKYYTEFPTIGLAVDLSRMNFGEDLFAGMQDRMQQAFDEMASLERGAIANKDENRMVGHYWLRNPALALDQEIRKEIEDTVRGMKDFARKVHSGEI